MRRIERVATAVAVAVLTGLTGGLSACSGTMSAADPAATAQARASAPDRAAEAPESSTAAPEPVDDAAAEFEVDPCADYRALRTGLEGLTDVTPEKLSAATADVLRGWGELTVAGTQPDGMGPRIWNGVHDLATRAAALPEEPSTGELRSVNVEFDSTLEWYAAACA